MAFFPLSNANVLLRKTTSINSLPFSASEIDGEIGQQLTHFTSKITKKYFVFKRVRKGSDYFLSDINM